MTRRWTQPGRPMWPARVIGLAILGVSVLSGCNSASEQSSPASTRSLLQSEETKVLLAPVDIQQFKRDASEYQYKLIGDGTLMFSEYEQAFLATVQCLEEAGIVADDTAISAEESYMLSLWYPDEAHLRDGEPKAADCQREYFTQVSRVWAMRDMSKYTPIYEAARESLVACVRASGLDLPENPPDDDLHRYRDAFDPSYFRCLKSVQEESRLPGWSP